jgi:hypothetical protein
MNQKVLMLSKYVEDQIIHNHLMGFSRDEIAKNTNVATGSVSNKINEWKKRTAIPDIDEIRHITTLIRKSNLDVRQCVKGFRIFQLLKKFNIIEENNDVDSDLNSLSFFVNEIYSRCKEYGLSPNTITFWLIDLLDFTIKNYQYLQKRNNPTSLGASSASGEQINKNKVVPPVSLISDFIEEKKNELEHIFHVERNTRYELKKYEEQIKEQRDEISRLKQEKEYILRFHETFIQLEDILKKQSNIDLRKDLEPFSKLFYDFKENGYNVTNIINQYNKSIKLEWDIKFNENQIQAYRKQLTDLQNNIITYQSLLDNHSKNWDLYQQLKAMKFGIEELKQLWLTVSEIIKDHSDPLKDSDRIDNPVAFFIKDVENNYYEKLKFEDRVNKKKNELALINAQIYSGRQNLLAQQFLGSILFSLFQKGIDEQDIVKMNHIFSDIQLLQDLSIDGQKREEELLSDQDNDSIYNNKGKRWKILIKELRKYGGIKTAIKIQSENLDKLIKKKEILIEQNRNLSNLYENAIALFQMINNHYYYYKGFVEHISWLRSMRMINHVLFRVFPVIILFYSDNANANTNGEQNAEE